MRKRNLFVFISKGKIMKKNVSIYQFIALLISFSVLLAAFCRKGTIESADPDSFTFAVLGDRTTGHTPGVFKGIVEQINQLNPEIVLNVGDIIEGYSRDIQILSDQWKEYMAIHKLVKAPYYYTVGNHDVSPEYDEVMLPLFKQFLGDPQYTFTHKNTYFIMFDTSIWESYDDLPESQWKWLENALIRRPDTDNIFVFMHRPYWLDYIGSDKPDRMHDLFKKYNVTAVFSGHYHYFCSAEIEGIFYTELGSSGGELFKGVIEDEGRFYHFLYGSVKGKEISLGVVRQGDPENTILPWDIVTLDYLKQKHNLKE